MDGVRGVTCNCGGTGFQGAQCESNVNDCSASSCLNGGRCIDEVNDVSCDCTNTGFEGDNCQNNVNACVGRICNSGICIDGNGPGALTCDCRGTGFNGNRCENNINACTASSCQNGGRCIDGTGENEFSCDCTGTGFSGRTCDVPNLRGNGQSCDADGQCQSGNCILAETAPHGGICCIENCGNGQFCRVASVNVHQCVDCVSDQNECPTGCGRNGFCNPTLADGTACTDDDQCNPGSLCILHYLDSDGDEFAVVGAETARFCAVRGSNSKVGYTAREPGAQNATDCLEGNASVNPSQRAFFSVRFETTPSTALSNGFDYNCSGAAEPEFANFAGCAGTVLDPVTGSCSLPGGGNEAGYANGQGGPPTAACGSDTNNFVAQCVRGPGDVCSSIGNPAVKRCR